MAIFSTCPSYSWSPSRRKYVRDWGLETTAIMPLGAFTTPSRRSVLTCRPALPGGKFFPESPPALSWPISDSNGSRRATFNSDSAGGFEPVDGADAFTAFLLAFFAAGLAGAFAACWAGALGAGFAGALVAGLAACGAGFNAAVGAGAGVEVFAGVFSPGFAGAGGAGLAGCCPGFAGVGDAAFGSVPLAGLDCASRFGAAAPSKIPSTRVLAKSIVLSFPFSVSRPAWLVFLALQLCPSQLVW